MTDGLLMPPGSGDRIQSASMTLKVGKDQAENWSVFETNVGPGFDVGAHFHDHAEEMFYVLHGELDLLAFHPQTEVQGDWLTWESATGQRVYRGGPGSLMFVPARCPHAFHNPGSAPARMLFVVSPPGHEHYLRELADLIAGSEAPDPSAVAELRTRHDIHQLTPLRTRT